MHIAPHELWTVFHGMVFGALYLLAFSGGLAGLTSLHAWALTPSGMQERMTRLKWGLLAMAMLSWLTVASGTLMVYPGYREKAPLSTRSLLLASESTAEWHHFGMEWKEHVAFLVPILTTCIAAVVWHYGTSLAKRGTLRNALVVVLLISFAAAAAAGVFGAFIDKVAHTVAAAAGGGA